MLTKGEVATLLVAWSSMNDIQLADNDACLPQDVCSPEDRVHVRRAATLVDRLRTDFSFVKSPRFQRQVEGKSAAFSAMKQKLEDEPSKRAQHARLFDAALNSILASEEVYDLVPAERHADLRELQARLQRLGNPE